MDQLRSAGAGLVIGDHPERPFQTHEFTADFTVVRFMRGRRGRKGNYSATELDEWAERIAGWRDRATCTPTSTTRARATSRCPTRVG